MTSLGGVQGPIHNFVSSILLPKLACIKCKNYLSYFPIFTNPMVGSVCGRCTVGNQQDFIRNELYETGVQLQKFPCIYEKYGCLEKLLPSSVPGHEAKCRYKKLYCPTREYNNCCWQGYSEDILEHFELKHPTFILKEGTFEVDFINVHKENYLFPYGEDLFVVRRQAAPAESKFICCVSQLNSNNDSSNTKYILILESGNRETKHSISQNLNTDLEINGDNVRSVLNDPMSIIARLEIQKLNVDNSEKFSMEDSKENETDSAIDYEQLEDLECPVCFEYLVPPIYQCDVGHSICSKCKDTQSQCPSCREPFKEKLTQNYTLEKIVKNLIYPCKHKKCKFATKAKDIKQHETACIFGPFKCPLRDYENCMEEMSVMDIYEHIANNHYESLLEIETISIPFEAKDIWTDEDNFEECYIIKHSLQLFKLCFVFNAGKCYWSVQLLGPPEECVKFHFEFEIIDNSGSNGRIYFKKVCAPLANKNETFSEDKIGSFVCLEYRQIKSFVVRQLTYRVRVFLNRE